MNKIIDIKNYRAMVIEFSEKHKNSKFTGMGDPADETVNLLSGILKECFPLGATKMNLFMLLAVVVPMRQYRDKKVAPLRIMDSLVNEMKHFSQNTECAVCGKRKRQIDTPEKLEHLQQIAQKKGRKRLSPARDGIIKMIEKMKPGETFSAAEAEKKFGTIGSHMTIGKALTICVERKLLATSKQGRFMVWTRLENQGE